MSRSPLFVDMFVALTRRSEKLPIHSSIKGFARQCGLRDYFLPFVTGFLEWRLGFVLAQVTIAITLSNFFIDPSE